MTASRPGERGFTYLAALMIVSVMGVMLAMVGQSWKMVMQREREEELVFRGRQVVMAIERKIKCSSLNRTADPDGMQALPLIQDGRNSLEQLVNPVKCFNAINEQILLRPSAMLDPMTNRQWQMVKAPNDPSKQKFVGVASTSMDKPFRGTFADDPVLKELPLDGKQKYSEWEFKYQPPMKKQHHSTVTLPGK